MYCFKAILLAILLKIMKIINLNIENIISRLLNIRKEGIWMLGNYNILRLD